MKRQSLRFGHGDLAAFAAFTVYSVCSLLIPLALAAMGRSLGFPLEKGGMASGGFLHAVRSAFMIVTLLLCGLLAVRPGKRLSLGTSLLFCGAGMLCCACAPSYYLLIPGLILAGLGEGVCEGLLTPFIQDLHPTEPERYVNIGHAFWSVGIILAVLGAGGLLGLGVNWRPILAAAGLAAGLAAWLFLHRKSPEETDPGRFDLRDHLRKLRTIAAEPDFWICSAGMFFGAGAEFGLTFWSAAFLELTFGTGAFVSGLGTGAIAAGMFCGRTGTGCIAKPGNLHRILLSAACGTIPLTLALAALKPGVLPGTLLYPGLFFLLFLCGVGIAPYWPTLQVFGAGQLRHCDSTLLYILFSATGIPGCGFFAWLMGKAGDMFGTAGTILVVPACLVFFIAVVLIECRRAKKKGPERPGA